MHPLWRRFAACAGPILRLDRADHAACLAEYTQCMLAELYGNELQVLAS